VIDVAGAGLARAYGTQVFGWASFVPNGSQFQTLVDGFGIRTIERLAAGRWRVTLAEKCPGFMPSISFVENDTTNLHEAKIESVDLANGQFTFVHRTAAYGSLGSLALSDTVDQVLVSFVGRVQTA
jgi:hypothetical protein